MANENNYSNEYYGTIKITLPLLYKLMMWARHEDTDEMDIYKMLEKINYYGYIKDYLSISDLSTMSTNCMPIEPAPVPPPPVEPTKK